MDEEKAIITAYAYDSQNLAIKSLTNNIKALPELLEKWPTVWIRVVHATDESVLQDLFKILNINVKQIEHILDPNHTAHITFFANDLIKMSHIIYYDVELCQKQITYFLGKNFLLSVQMELGAGVEQVTMLLGDKNLPLRQGKADLLLCHLLGVSVDSYLKMVRHIGDGIDMIEDNLVFNPDDFALTTFFNLRKRLTLIKRDIWLQRDVMSQIVTFGKTEQQTIIQPSSIPLFGHCAERTSEILELMDTYIDHYRGLLDIYFSSTSNQINQVMKILTIFSAVFLPLSFLAGLWGMNFDYNVSHLNMPELHWKYGYLAALSCMFLIFFGLLAIFYKIGWLRLARHKKREE